MNDVVKEDADQTKALQKVGTRGSPAVATASSSSSSSGQPAFSYSSSASRRRFREPLDIDLVKQKTRDPARCVEQPSMSTDRLLDSSVISCMLIQEAVKNSLLTDEKQMYLPQIASDSAVEAWTTVDAGTSSSSSKLEYTEAQRQQREASRPVFDLNPDLTVWEDDNEGAMADDASARPS